MRFGERLRALRRQEGLTLRALADAVDLDFTYLSKIENEKVDYTPSVEKIRLFAQVLHADELELLELADKTPPELKSFARHVSGRAFLQRVQTLDLSEDWDDLLQYLDKKQAERKKSASEGHNK